MRYFPMFLDMRGRRALLAGGGEQVAQKARLLRRAEARLTVMSSALSPELAGLVEAGVLDHVAADFDAEAVAGADFVFIGDMDEAAADRIAGAAKAGGALVNVIDRPEACDMITPALVDRAPVVVAIGTEGAAPVLGRRIKTGLEATLSPRLGAYVARLAALRPAIAEGVARDRQLDLWRWAVDGAPWRLWDDGREAEAEAALRAAIAAGGAPEAEPARVTIIETPAAPDLAPLRAVRRLQEAALIVHAADADPGLIDLARRDAARLVLDACPRGDDAALRAAAEGADGPVVIVAPVGCGAAIEGWTGLEAERIAAAPEFDAH